MLFKGFPSLVPEEHTCPNLFCDHTNCKLLKLTTFKLVVSLKTTRVYGPKAQNE